MKDSLGAGPMKHPKQGGCFWGEAQCWGPQSNKNALYLHYVRADTGMWSEHLSQAEAMESVDPVTTV